MNDLTSIEEDLRKIEEQLLKREIKTVTTAGGPWVELSNGERVLQFASNNYLGLANHPEIINASKLAMSKYGVGSTGSRLLSGTTLLHEELERIIAGFENTESAVFFSSGYSANIGLLSAVLKESDAVYSDEYNHASIVDGIRLSKAQKFIYKHNDMNMLEELLSKNALNYKNNFIVTDSVFSMDGDIANLHEIKNLAEKYNCINILDEAHATGIFGKTGSGLAEETNLQEYFPVRIGTCSKALGVEGGFCAGPSCLIEYLHNTARSFMFSTASSPAVLGGVIKSIELVKDGLWRREKLWQNAKNLYTGLSKNYKLKLNEFKSPIIVVLFNDIESSLIVSKKLFDECHIWAPAIRPPTVSQPRIRLTPIATHNDDDINYVIKAFNYVSQFLATPQILSKVT